MIEFTGLVTGLLSNSDLYLALFLHAMRKTTAQEAGPPCPQVPEKMVGVLPWAMHPAGPAAPEGTPGVQPDLILDPTGLYLFQFLMLLLILVSPKQYPVAKMLEDD